jgi:hypothetical protein
MDNYTVLKKRSNRFLAEQFHYLTDDKSQCLFTCTENMGLLYEHKDVFGS